MSRALGCRVLRLVAVAVVVGGACAWAGSALSEEEADDAAATPPADQTPWVQSAPSGADADVLFSAGVAGTADRRVEVIVAAHPDKDAVICLAGCGGGPRLVALRTREAAPISAAGAGGDSGRRLLPAMSTTTAAEGAAPTVEPTPDVADVICVAGCAGAPGEVVHRGVRLTWIDRGPGEELKAALRTVAERLAAAEHERAVTPAVRAADGVGQHWVSQRARRLLTDSPLPAVLAVMVRSAATMRGADHGGER
jgi:hypothetical protein